MKTYQTRLNFWTIGILCNYLRWLLEEKRRETLPFGTVIRSVKSAYPLFGQIVEQCWAEHGTCFGGDARMVLCKWLQARNFPKIAWGEAKQRNQCFNDVEITTSAQFGRQSDRLNSKINKFNFDVSEAWCTALMYARSLLVTRFIMKSMFDFHFYIKMIWYTSYGQELNEQIPSHHSWSASCLWSCPVSVRVTTSAYCPTLYY